MTKPRAYLVVLTILATAITPVFLSTAGSSSASHPLAFAAALSAPESANGNSNSNNSNSNDSNSNNSNSNSSSNSNSNSNGNGNSNSNSNSNNNNSNSNNSNGNNNNGNGNDNFMPPPPQRSSAPALAPAPVCSTPGQEMTFQSSDGRVTVRVFASLTQSVKFSIRMPIDPASVPPAPGQVVGGLLFQLLAESCDGTPIAALPAEVNLGVHYSDADAAGLNEANFTIARLDTTANQWRPSAKQAADPGANLTSATITEMGFYVLYQRP